MRSTRTVVVATLVALASTTMTACSSQDDAGSPPGIVVMVSTDTRRTIQITDPNSGRVIDEKHFSIGDKQQTLAGNGIVQGYAQLSAFSADFSKLAIRQKFGSGWHVGVLEATDDPVKVSKFTDLSGDTDADTITAPVNQSTGAFGPDGKLYAIEQGQAGTGVRVIDVGSGESELLNKQLYWQEHDESGNSVTVNATPDKTSPYFLPHGKELEVAPDPNKVYSPDGDWGFWTPAGDTEGIPEVTRGDLQKASGGDKPASVKMPYDPVSGIVTDINPVVYIDRSHFVSERRYGGDRNVLHYATFNRENIVVKPLRVGAPNSRVSDPIPNPDNSSFSFTQKTEDGKYSLHTAKVDGTSVKKIADLRIKQDGTSVSLLGWN